ncbi:MAG: enoyl-CoA hydratase [Burkholderiaceae bacterium]
MAARLLTERRDGTLVLTFSNPGFRNALGPEIYEPAMQAFADVEQDASIRAVVLTGADGTFCAGGNLNRLLENRARPPQVQADSIDALNRMTRAIVRCTRPVIAAVEGAAAGAGMSLALACDLITAGHGAKFVMAYVKVGLSPDGGGSWFASRALPKQAATELMLEGGAWPASRLHALGVVNALVDDGEALDAALDHARRIAALSPHAVGRIKKLIANAADATLEQQFIQERESFVACLHHEDGGEAIAAFLEKRPAHFEPTTDP